MKNYEIKIEGSGTLNQLAIRLLEIGRQMQIANVYSTPIELPKEDGCLTIEIKSDEDVEDVLYILGEDSINRININEKIPNDELFEYRIIHRESFIDELFRWIAEASKDSALMKEDLLMLINIKDEYIFSSISTNDYITKGDSRFNDTCKELLELNETIGE